MGALNNNRNFFIFFVVALLLFTANCSTLKEFAKSSDPYHTENYRKVYDKWSREARIHRGLEVELIVSATLKSREFRRAYSEEYAQAYKLNSQERSQYIENHVGATKLGYEFLMSTFVPQKEWDDFEKAQSMWKLYLVANEDQRMAPFEIRRIKRKDAVRSHFFPYITPWKSIYVVRFPYCVLKNGKGLIGNDTRQIKLVITSIVGTAEMVWNLE
ncbi:MAG: hypothetical protein JRD47_10685 [Deltaproteobacteria bacterium]|nr:hypothetical protein [Deltaproteobacteria bacterium]MBW2602362.1 hypothetical protein [Deltaproteobacteria bacterium]